MTTASSKPTYQESESTHGASSCVARILCIGGNVADVLRLQLQLDADFEFALVTCETDCREVLASELEFDLIIRDASATWLWSGDLLESLDAHSPEAERIVLASRMDAATRERVSQNARVMCVLLSPCPTMLLRARVADALLRHRARALRNAISTPPGGQQAVPRSTIGFSLRLADDRTDGT